MAVTTPEDQVGRYGVPVLGGPGEPARQQFSSREEQNQIAWPPALGEDHADDAGHRGHRAATRPAHAEVAEGIMTGADTSSVVRAMPVRTTRRVEQHRNAERKQDRCEPHSFSGVVSSVATNMLADPRRRK